MATTPPLRLNRAQLAQFLNDQEQIRAFENLFNVVEPLAPDVVAQLSISVGTAQAAATDAQGQVQTAEQAFATMLAACEAKANLALQQALTLNHIADLVETMPPPRERKRTRYGQFYDTTTQSISSANTAQAVTFNTSNISNGVYIGSPTSQIIVDTEGLYNFQASMQFDCTGGSNREVWVWLRLNGTDIADSAFYLNIQNANSEVLQAFNLFVDMKANDYVEVMWEVGNIAARLSTFAATGVHPAVPSIILTVSNNIRGEL